ncbi:MAG: helix-turn-helix transcriptional regulator [Solirubrobacteraceae bacterium]
MLERGGIEAAVGGLLDAVQARRGRALLLSAEAGLGKTTCLAAAVAMAGERGFAVGRARGEAMESSLAFGVATVLTEPLGGPDLLGRPSGTEPPAQVRAAKFFEVLRWAAARSAERPLLLAVDDLHWSDQDSLELLCFLARRLDGLGVGVFATLRPWPLAAHEAALALGHAGHAVLERLAPLSEPAAGELLRARCGRQLDPELLARSWAVSHGNPLLLDQVAATIARGESLPTPDGARLGPHADALLLARFAGLDRASLRCAQAASVLGLRFRPDLAMAVAGLDPGREDGALAALTGTGLVRAVPGTGLVEFTHPLFAQALGDDLDPALRAAMHRRAFAALLERGLEDEAAEHASAGNLVGDERAAAVLERVGRRALGAGALQSAVSLLEEAARLAPGECSAALRLTLAGALLEAGRPREAIEHASSLPDGDGATVAGALRLLGTAHYATGEHELAARRFDEAVAAAEEPAQAVEALLLHAVLRGLTDGPAAALPELTRARAVGAGLSDGLRLRVEGHWGYMAVLGGDPAGCEPALAHARALLADPRGDLARAAWRDVTMYGAAAKYLERLDVAEWIHREFLQRAGEPDVPGGIAAVHTGHSETLVRTGRLAEALAASTRACEAAELATHVTATLATAGMAHVLLLLGRLPESEEWCGRAQAMALTGRGSWLAQLRVWDLRGHRALREADFHAASGLYRRAMDLCERIGLGEPCVVPWAAHALEAHAATGAGADAERVLDWLERCSKRLPCRWPRGAAALGRALLAERAGDPARADSLFGAALAVHEQAQLPLDRIETLIAWGGFLRRQREPRRARGALAGAIALAEEAGAAWHAERATTELLLAGGRRRTHHDRDELTAAERRVARLAADGMSNREIAEHLWLSVNTVQSHLKHTYAKLGIESRRQLMLLAREREPAWLDGGAQGTKDHRLR